MINGAQVERTNPWRLAAIVAGCIVGWFVIVYGFAAILRATGSRPGPGAQSSLWAAWPTARDDSGRFLGYSRFDATELNRIQQGRELRAIRYVGPDVPSTGPDVVSVNVVDDFTWGAAALSDENGHCYLMLHVTDRERPELEPAFFERLPRGEPCLGASAVPERVRASDWPDFEGDALTIVEILFAGLFLLAPVAAGIAWAVAEIRNAQDRSWGTLRWLGAGALAIVGWWAGGGAALGTIGISVDHLDAREVVASLIWSTIGLAVLGLGASAFVAGRRRGYEPPRTLAFTGLVLLLAGLPVLLLLAAETII